MEKSRIIEKALKIAFPLSMACLVISSCFYDSESDGCNDYSTDVITIEEALQTLNAFLGQVDKESISKSGAGRQIASIETVYKDHPLTKSGDESPRAYIVNFENDEGFAVLGATSQVPGIVAVTEHGSLSAEDLSTTPNRCDSIDLWDYENNDFYSFESKREFISLVINEELDTSAGSRPSSPVICTIPYMVQTKWSQGTYGQYGIYNKYCRTNNGNTYAYAGCSTIAIAQIIAYNKRPAAKTYRGTEVNFDDITSAQYASSLNNSEHKEELSCFIGHIFDNTSNLFTFQAGTAITATSVKSYLEDNEDEYTNIQLYSASEFSDDMLSATYDMLMNGKPVFVSAMSSALSGHSWVIDGARYATTGQYQYSYLLHCNWGWAGDFDGYFSTGCFWPNDTSAIYDDTNQNQLSEYEEYTWHYRLLTYDFVEE